MFIWLSIAAGFLAAGLWLYAARIKVPTNISSGYGGLLGLKKWQRDLRSKQPGTVMLLS
jgi:hypothetical protein